MSQRLVVRKICILGATSAIAEQTARLLAARGDSLALVARNPIRLQAIAADLATRGSGKILQKCADLATLDDPDALMQQACEDLGGVDAVLMFHGDLGDQALAELETAEARRIMQVNFVSAAELSLAAARQLCISTHPRPVLLSIGSVAGDRGRASNYVYGAAKGGLAILFQGLQHSFARKYSRVHAVVIKAGFVDTPMTSAFDKGGPLWTKPESIARIVVAALDRGPPIIYAPWFWRWIMLIIRLLPQPIMNKLNL